MFDTNELLSMLSTGKSPEDLASAFTESLNEAIQQKKDMEATKPTAAVQAADKVIDTVHKFLYDFYPDLAFDRDLLTGEELVELLDEVGPVIAQYIGLMSAIEDMSAHRTTARDDVKPKTQTVRAKTPDEALEKFFKLNGLV